MVMPLFIRSNVLAERFSHPSFRDVLIHAAVKAKRVARIGSGADARGGITGVNCEPVFFDAGKNWIGNSARTMRTITMYRFASKVPFNEYLTASSGRLQGPSSVLFG